MKRVFKKFLRHNNYVIKIITILLYCYLKFVYLTSKKQFIFNNVKDKANFSTQQGAIFAFWHNMLALSPIMFRSNKDIYALISPHLDGRILNNLVSKFGCGVIVGSTNKNPISALRIIIQKLSKGGNIIITPDGPKGPIYKVNSSITEIARKYNKKLIPIVANSSKSFRFKSWDKLIMPLPFGNINIIVGAALDLTDNKEQNDLELEHQLVNLNNRLL